MILGIFIILFLVVSIFTLFVAPHISLELQYRLCPFAKWFGILVLASFLLIPLFQVIVLKQTC